MSIKMNFDLSRSLKESPPEIYYNQLGPDGKPLFPGTRFIKRLVLNRDLVRYLINEQIREEDAGETRYTSIMNSYKNVGYLYQKAPQGIKVNPNDPKMFSGVSGWGRNKAQDQLGWKTMIYDILEFDSPLAEEIFKINSNETDEFSAPATPNTKTTYIKSVVNAIHGKLIAGDDQSILDYLKQIARTHPNWHSNILSIVRKEHISRFGTMQAWNTSDAKRYAKEHNLQYEGSGNKNLDRLGYVRKITSLKNVFWDSMTLSSDNGWQTVDVHTWIDEPKPSDINRQRKEISKKFRQLEQDFQRWIAWYINMPTAEVADRGADRFPIVFKGFLPQDLANDILQDGNPFESGIIPPTPRTDEDEI